MPPLCVPVVVLPCSINLLRACSLPPGVLCSFSPPLVFLPAPCSYPLTSPSSRLRSRIPRILLGSAAKIAREGPSTSDTQSSTARHCTGGEESSREVARMRHRLLAASIHCHRMDGR